MINKRWNQTYSIKISWQSKEISKYLTGTYHLGLSPSLVVVGDTQSDSIQCLNFAKKWFIQYSIQYCFTQDSIQNIIQFKKNSADSIQKIIQFISQGIIDTGRMGKVPKNYLKNVQNRLKKGLFIKNGKYWFKIWFIHSFHNKIQFKGLFNIIFSGIFNSKNYSIIFFPRKFN